MLANLVWLPNDAAVIEPDYLRTPKLIGLANRLVLKHTWSTFSKTPVRLKVETVTLLPETVSVYGAGNVVMGVVRRSLRSVRKRIKR